MGYIFVQRYKLFRFLSVITPIIAFLTFDFLFGSLLVAVKMYINVDLPPHSLLFLIKTLLAVWLFNGVLTE
jgi:hypothetical protein